MIEIDELIMRSLQLSDLNTLTEIWSDPKVTQFLPSRGVAIPPDKVKKSLQSFVEHWEERGYGIWAIINKDSDKMIGYCGLRYLDELEEVELVYGLARAYWGRQIITKAASASILFGFEVVKLEKIVAMVLADNYASRRVIEKLGFSYEKQIDIFNLEAMYFSLANNAI